MAVADGADRFLAKVAGSFAGTGNGSSGAFKGLFNVLATGVGTVELQRSFDGGTTFVACCIDGAATPASWAVTAATPVNLTWYEPEDGVLYRLSCTAFTSAIAYRLSN